MPHTILYVEDDQLVADIVREMLEARGWQVVTCASGGEAMRELWTDTVFDLLITDNHLPDLSGFALVRYVRKQLKNRAGMPIVMFSADDCAGAAYHAGVTVFLRKPADSELLVSTIERLLSQGA